jgi:hypothetical protein
MSSYVHPRDVEAFRQRLAPAFASAAQSGERGARLFRVWQAYCTEPAGWLEAPWLLERGRDLEAQLAIVQGPGRSSGYYRDGAPSRSWTGSTAPATENVGTVMGEHSIAELADLVKAQRFQLDQLDKARGCSGWAAADPKGYGAWAADVYDATAKMNDALKLADMAIAITPDAVAKYTPTVVEWKGVVDAAQPFGDLVRRFTVAGFCPWPEGKMPQPAPGSDADLDAYLWADKKTEAIEKTADEIEDKAASAGKWVALGVVAGLGVLLLARR